MSTLIRTSVIIGGSRLSDNDFTSVMISQRVGSHHTFEIRLRQDASRGLLLDMTKSWIGKAISIGIGFKEDRQIKGSPIGDVFKGIVTSLGLSRQSGSGELVVRGESPTIMLEDGPNTRSFTEKGLQEIADTVLKPYKGVFAAPPSVKPILFKDTRHFCVQYKESNFAFLTRLANRYGEWFYYDGLDLYFGKPSSSDKVTLDFGENSLSYFDISVKAIPAKFEMHGYDYTSHKDLEEKAPDKAKNNDLGKAVLDASKNKIYTQSPIVVIQTSFEEGEFKNLATRREQINLDEMVLFNGASRNSNLKVGVTIEVKDKELGESYGSYIITSLVHDIGQGGDYHNTFEAVPAEVTTPPLSAMPNPPFCETQLATVADVEDEDSLGRVKVQFLWQKGTEEYSPWIRVASPYTGKDKGFYIIPEVDDQVLVAFENNNPDKPYVLTGMYNGDAKPEWFDSKNKFKGFKSKGKNEWKFDDKAQRVSIYAPKEILLHGEEKVLIKTGGKKDSEISIDAGDGTVNVVAKIINITAAETIVIESGSEITIDSGQKIAVDSGQEIKISAGQKIETKSMEVKTEASVKAELKGTMVDINGSGPVAVKGMPIKLN